MDPQTVPLHKSGIFSPSQVMEIPGRNLSGLAYTGINPECLLGTLSQHHGYRAVIGPHHLAMDDHVFHSRHQSFRD